MPFRKMSSMGKGKNEMGRIVLTLLNLECVKHISVESG